MPTLYAEVILPLPLNATFTYRIPEAMTDSVKVGYRVIVQFGAKKYYTGIVSSISHIAPEGFEVKDIVSYYKEKTTFVNYLKDSNNQSIQNKTIKIGLFGLGVSEFIFITLFLSLIALTCFTFATSDLSTVPHNIVVV